MDAPSEAKLALVHPLLRDKVQAAMSALAGEGIYFRVAQGLRTYAEQDKLYAQGRNGNPGRVVTNARGGWSNHNFGCAVDCFPFVHGPAGALDLDDPEAPEFKAMVGALKAQGLAWGGDWRKPDSPHFQLPNVPVTPTAIDRAAFARGGLKAVWAMYP